MREIKLLVVCSRGERLEGLLLCPTTTLDSSIDSRSSRPSNGVGDVTSTTEGECEFSLSMLG